MKKLICLFILILMTVIIPAAAGSAEPEIILYTFYRQIGEGDELQIGTIDQEGVIRTLSGRFSEMGWDEKARLDYLSDTDRFTVEGRLDFEELFAVKSLISCLEDQGTRSHGAAEDAGTEESWAVRYTEGAEPEFILLGVSGESVFENTDPNAQALYLRLRRIFPGVISFAYDPYGMGPAGFIPVPVAGFTGLDEDALDGAEIRAVYSDSEEGLIPLELTDADKSELLALIRDGSVTGKADCISSTGGVTSYTFYGPDGTMIGTVDFEDGLLVTNDGRYYTEMP